MTTRTTTPLDLAAIRERLAAGGPQFWRGLDELARTEAFQEMLQREFPDEASAWADPVTRRRFLTLMGASLALAGVSGCSSQPAPEGTHWSSRYDRARGRKCWFLADASGREVTALPAQPSAAPT